MTEIKKNEKIFLYDGKEIPLIGLRTNDVYAEDIIYYSIKDGVRLIYVSHDSDNIKNIGKGIKKAIDNDLVSRKDLFIIGKFRLTKNIFVENIIEDLLNQLNLEYLDLFLNEWPIENEDKEGIKYDISAIWKQMEKLIEMELTKSIGLCNYNIQSIERILSFCDSRPVVNAIEFHPYYFQEDIKKFCKSNEIVLLALTPIARGDNIKSYINQKKEDKLLEKFHENINTNLVYKYEKTAGQIILNWHIQQGVVPIVSTSKINRMEENLEALKFRLDYEDIDYLCSLGAKIKLNDNKEIYDSAIFI